MTRSILLPLLLVLAGCSGAESEPPAGANPAAAGAAAPAVSNRIDVPPAVRENLGITFAKVEQRAVASTVRVPGRFELLPSARREYRCPLPGRVSLAVRQYQRVKQGDLILRLDSPEWRRIQLEAAEAEGEIKLAEAKLQVSQAARVETAQAVELQQDRVGKLAEANVRRSELEAALAELRNRLPRLDAEVRAAGVALAEAKEHYQSRLNTLSSVVGLPVSRLQEPAPPAAPTTAPADGSAAPAPAGPRWRAIDFVEVYAADAGVVESVAVTDGAWTDAAALALVTVDPRALRFKAVALQSDLARLRDDLPASIVPPAGAGPGAGAVAAELKLGLAADPEQRTVELIATPAAAAPWMRAGVTTSLEVVTDQAAESSAIPVAAVVQDGLEHVFFRRDPKDPDKVIRTDADLGVSDGRWVMVKSGVKAGDEVVLDGVYELKLTGVGKPQGGGHFHADGTWHAEGTPEPTGGHN